MSKAPGREDFTDKEWAIIERLKGAREVQRYLTEMPYNWERNGPTLRSFREVVRRNTAHCLEAALAAAVILEQHGYPPLLLDLESQDKLDHVIFIFRENGLWGSIGRSRDRGLHGRKPVFRTLRELADSYFDPYVDETARITGYGVANLYDLGDYDWRFSRRNMRRVEQHLFGMPHRKFQSSEKRYRALLARFREFRKRHPGKSPAYFENRHQWMR